jgi:hypothetical protein
VPLLTPNLEAMSSDPNGEKPTGVYLVALYFVLAAFLEPIGKYYDSEQPWSFVPMAEHSVWNLAADPIIYLSIAYLIWRYAAFGRLAALVLGYLMLAFYLGSAAAHFVFHAPVHLTPMVAAISVFHILALPGVVWYLQPARQKKLFHVSLWDILLSSD